MSRTPVQRIQTPDELREILLEFTISYLLEQPGDVVDYAHEYFTRLKENRTTLVEGLNIPDAESTTSFDEIPKTILALRRRSVFDPVYSWTSEESNISKICPKSDEQRTALIGSLKNILFFRDIDQDQLLEVIDSMVEKPVCAGEFIINQGDDGEHLYVIQEGTFHAYVTKDRETSLLHVYENAGYFGELALLYNTPRAATVQAKTNGILWSMDRISFKRILYKSTFRKRTIYEGLIESVPMLKSLKPYERMNLADALITRYFTNDDVIIHQGEKADGMYFIEKGIVRITMMDENGKECEIQQLEKGQYFGELALVTNKPRAANAIAVNDVQVAFIDVEAFERLLGPCMDIMKRNIQEYEKQLVEIFGSKANIKDIR